MSRNGSVLTIYLMPTKNSDSFKDLMVMQFYSLGINLCLGSHLTVNSNLIKNVRLYPARKACWKYVQVD